MALVSNVGGLIAAVGSLGHVDLDILPCNGADPDMLWLLPPTGKEGQIIHQASKLCLMSADCKVETGGKGALVLDDCKTPWSVCTPAIPIELHGACCTISHAT